ncbi:Zn-dependent alcohol dehydrogenase [Chachezhania antarctica]|uniref:Zn-dependent alcohol dehydrogenase n=1 Tax=Chachezhania antarctica TaxID=2340860 RepID=UPI000EAE3D6D|nr:Zn-dependent alcohol dehydrogenase [Chachezhania antarctica]|tara:strand:- start:50 stop:1135 length:1086 start_codon:yes stop_codon:yes gene_type:complete
MQTIKAAVCREFGKPLTIEEIQIDEPGPGQVAVDIDAVAICHSDISLAEGAWGGPLPAVFGHEGAGRVTAVGEGVRTVKPGDSVCVTLLATCGECPTCSAGRPALCANKVTGAGGPVYDTDGGPMLQGLSCGAFAQKVVAVERQVVKIPDDVPKDSASLISCGVITGVGAAVVSANIRPGQDVVVIGAGGVGLNAIQGARIAGARRIVAVDMLPEKLEVAKEFGATDGVLASDEKPWRAAMQAMGKGADAVLVTVGVIPAYQTAHRYLDRGGKVYMVGMPHGGAKAEYEPVVLAATAQGMIGSFMGDVVIQRDIPWMVDLYKQGRLKLDELISKRWKLEEINEAIADTNSGAARRNVIVFD